MAGKPPDGLPWGLLPSTGSNGPRRARDRETARRGRSFTSRDKEKEMTRLAWTINGLPDPYACTDTHTAAYYANT